MGRKINVAQPMVLDIVTVPLTEMFSVEPVGANATTEQWYYANDNAYLPDRQTHPLTLAPILRTFDPDTKIVVSPTLYTTRWFLLQNGNYNTEITSTDTTADYYKSGFNLVVRKNVPYSSSVSILCECIYIDPRTNVHSDTIKAQVTLCTNRDATITEPTVRIQTEKVIAYNPFVDASSQFTFTAKVYKDNEDITSTSRVVWYASENNEAENAIDTTLPDGGYKYLCYKSGQNTPTLVLDAMYANTITIVARVWNTSKNRPYVTRDQVTMMWDEMKIDAMVRSNNSGAVRTNTQGMTFETIINARNRTLTDAQKSEHFLINYKRWNAKKETSDPVIDVGWGQTTKLDRTELTQFASQEVYAEIQMLGGYERVYDDNAVVTDAGEIVVDRY